MIEDLIQIIKEMIEKEDKDEERESRRDDNSRHTSGGK